MNTFTKTYQAIGSYIMYEGFNKEDHKGETKMIPAHTFVVDELERMRFPMNTLRFNPIMAAIREYDAFTKGIKDTKTLTEEYKLDKIWGPWMNDTGLKYDYFKNWKESSDYIINKFNKDNYSRKLYHNQFTINSGAALSCCWDSFQLLKIGNKLNIIFKMISTDYWLGLPADVATAATILLNYCSVLGQNPGKIYIQTGDLHIYKKHWNNMKTFLNDEVKYDSPLVLLYNQIDMMSFKSTDLKIDTYQYNKRDYDNTLVSSIEDNK